MASSLLSPHSLWSYGANHNLVPPARCGEVCMRHPRCGFMMVGDVLPRVCTRGYRQMPIPWAFGGGWLHRTEGTVGIPEVGWCGGGAKGGFKKILTLLH